MWTHTQVMKFYLHCCSLIWAVTRFITAGGLLLQSQRDAIYVCQAFTDTFQYYTIIYYRYIFLFNLYFGYVDLFNMFDLINHTYICTGFD